MVPPFRLPQAAVSEEPGAREAESRGRASALKFPAADSNHNLLGITVITINPSRAKARI